MQPGVEDKFAEVQYSQQALQITKIHHWTRKVRRRNTKHFSTLQVSPLAEATSGSIAYTRPHVGSRGTGHPSVYRESVSEQHASNAVRTKRTSLGAASSTPTTTCFHKVVHSEASGEIRLACTARRKVHANYPKCSRPVFNVCIGSKHHGQLHTCWQRSTLAVPPCGVVSHVHQHREVFVAQFRRLRRR